MNVCKQTFPIFHVRLSQNLKSSTYYFHVKTKRLADFQISISVLLSHFMVIQLQWRNWFKPWAGAFSRFLGIYIGVNSRKISMADILHFLQLILM